MKTLGVGTLAAALALAACGFAPDATYRLEPQCRLPRWVALPRGVARSAVNVRLDHYTSLIGYSADVQVTGADGHVFSKVRARVLADKPLQLAPQSGAYPPGYPSYEVVRGAGVVDVIEHRNSGPGFCMSDDPRVWDALAPRPRG